MRHRRSPRPSDSRSSVGHRGVASGQAGSWFVDPRLVQEVGIVLVRCSRVFLGRLAHDTQVHTGHQTRVLMHGDLPGTERETCTALPIDDDDTPHYSPLGYERRTLTFMPLVTLTPRAVGQGFRARLVHQHAGGGCGYSGQQAFHSAQGWLWIDTRQNSKNECAWVLVATHLNLSTTLFMMSKFSGRSSLFIPLVSDDSS